MPEITVLMPAYNAGPYLREAIESVLGQTFRDFEFLLIDDGSTDGSSEVVRGFNDPRIRLVRNETNQGVAATLNQGLALASGRYVARMDSDDISLPHRLEVQVAFMKRNPQVVVAGSWARYVGRFEGHLERRPFGPACVNAYLLFDNPLIHPSIMLNREYLKKESLTFDPAFSRSEDYELWCRVGRTAALDNLPRVLLHFRVHDRSVTRTATADMEVQTLEILRRQLALLGLAPSDDELRFHRDLGHGKRIHSLAELERAEQWLISLLKTHRQQPVFDVQGLEKTASMVWFKVCFNSANLGIAGFRRYALSGLSRAYRISLAQALRYLVGIGYHMARRKGADAE